MKQVKKRVLSAMLVLALLICTIPIATAQSAKIAKAATENTMEKVLDKLKNEGMI